MLRQKPRVQSKKANESYARSAMRVGNNTFPAFSKNEMGLGFPNLSESACFFPYDSILNASDTVFHKNPHRKL